MWRVFYIGILVTVLASAQPPKKSPSIGRLHAAPNFDSPAVYQVTQPIDHAEGPLWDGRKNLLYYVDIHTGRVLSYNYNTKKVNFITLNGDVTPIVTVKNNENVLVVGLNRSLVAVEWDGESEVGAQRVLATVSQQYPRSRFNEGKADQKGRIWIGTMGSENPTTGALQPNEGVVYKFTKAALTQPVVEIAPVNISNGLAWNHNNTKLYYIDSPTRKIVVYDFDNEKGEISNPRVAVDVAKFPSVAGVPDGMTIDKDENLWIALYGGGSVIKANPNNGQLLQTIPIAARDVTSVMWGGPNLDILFVSTSRISLNYEERKIWPAAGSVFAVTNVGTKGVPIFHTDVVDSLKKTSFLEDLLQNTNDLFAAPISNEIGNGVPSEHVKRTAKNEETVPFWTAVREIFRSIF